LKRIKVRFNLGRGDNYLKWKVEYPDGRAAYYHPALTQLVMKGCTLRNYKDIAKKIHAGANKRVCAWVLCEDIEIVEENFSRDETRQVKYNPRVSPHWLDGGEVADNRVYDKLHTVWTGVYVS
jgi:hypothetical protein